MIRVFLLLAVLAACYLFLRWFRRTPAAEIARLARQSAWGLALLLLVLLAVTGKLTALLAGIGVALAFVLRLLPVALKYAPHLERLWGWYRAGNAERQETGGQQRGSAGRQSRDTAMSRAEALEVLGLPPAASAEDIIAAHRRLIARLHPDKGGTAYLAARINLARQVLLQR